MQTSECSSEILNSIIISDFRRTVNYNGENIFHELCRHGNLFLLQKARCWLDKKTKFLLQQYNLEGDQCTHIVAHNHRKQEAVRLMEALMDLGADLNASSRVSGTALHIAVFYQDYELVTWICQQTGVDLEAYDSSGLTAYQIAWKRGDFKMVDIFFKFDADCNQAYPSDSSSEFSGNKN